MTLKKKIFSLCLCCALVVSGAAVQPPEADAAVVVPSDGALAALLLAAATAAGIEFGSDQMTSSGLTAYIGEQLETYAAKVGTTVAGWVEGLGEISRRDDGTVLLTPPAYTAIQDFWSSWRTDNEIVSGTSGQRVADAFYVNIMGVNYNVGEGYPQLYGNPTIFDVYPSFVSMTHFSILVPISATIDSPYEIVYGGQVIGTVYWTNLNEGGTLNFEGSSGGTLIRSRDFSNYALCAFYNTNTSRIRFGIYSYDTSRSSFIIKEGFSDLDSVYARRYLTVSQPASYEVLDLQENQSIALDLGAIAAPDATLEDILEEYLAKIAANTAAATQTVVIAGESGGEGEGEGEDEDNPYLPYIPRIWNKIQSLPGDIADKFHDLFVPSAEYVAALPAEVAEVFESRAGLLTYPAALFVEFLTRISTLTAQEPVLRWGNINEPFSGRQLIAAGSYNLNSAVQSSAMSTVYNIYIVVVKAAVALWFVDLCKRKYDQIIRS